MVSALHLSQSVNGYASASRLMFPTLGDFDEKRCGLTGSGTPAWVLTHVYHCYTLIVSRVNSVSNEPLSDAPVLERGIHRCHYDHSDHQPLNPRNTSKSPMAIHTRAASVERKMTRAPSTQLNPCEGGSPTRAINHRLPSSISGDCSRP